MLRGGLRPWRPGPGHQPVSVATPTGGTHLWYAAPAIDGLHQVLADAAGRYGLAWQVDGKASWSYGVAPGAVTRKGTYHGCGGNPAQRQRRVPARIAQQLPRQPRPRARIGVHLHLHPHLSEPVPRPLPDPGRIRAREHPTEQLRPGLRQPAPASRAIAGAGSAGNSA